MRRVAWLGGVALMAVLAAVRAHAQGATPYLDEIPASAVIDAHWSRVAPGIQVAKVLNMQGKWAASVAWFYTDKEPKKYLMMSTLDSLMSWGLLNEQSRVSVETHRFLVSAHSHDEAVAAVTRRTAKKPPKAIRKRLEQDQAGPGSP